METKPLEHRAGRSREWSSFGALVTVGVLIGWGLFDTGIDPERIATSGPRILLESRWGDEWPGRELERMPARPLAVSVVDRMSPGKAGKLLAALPPAKAADLMQKLSKPIEVDAP